MDKLNFLKNQGRDKIAWMLTFMEEVAFTSTWNVVLYMKNMGRRLMKRFNILQKIICNPYIPFQNKTTKGLETPSTKGGKTKATNIKAKKLGHKGSLRWSENGNGSI